MFGYIALAALLGLMFWAIWIYNRLVRDRHRVDAGWSDIDVQLKRRHDLLPKLIEAVKQYASYEQATLTRVSELRSQSQQLQDTTQRSALETQLGAQVTQLFALAESYPDLKSDQSFLDLQTQISAVEKDIQHARRYYNGAVRNLNTRIDSFPDVLLARLLRYRYREYFDYEEN